MSRQGILASTASITSVNDNNVNQNLLLANTKRKGVWFYNDSTADLYLKMGANASTTSFSYKIPAGGFFEMPTSPTYQGQIDGVWSADSTGAVRITEF